jgi:hypothetical protein
MTLRATLLAIGICPLGLALGCNDVGRFSNAGDHYAGAIVAGGDVLQGFDAGAGLCLVLDANHLQDAPGTLSSNDHRFRNAPLRPIPKIWHDPLSTLSFGEGRVQNLVYVVAPLADADSFGDIYAVLSLMQSGAVEVRLLRGAPTIDGGDGADNILFGVFSLTRAAGPCSY